VTKGSKRHRLILAELLEYSLFEEYKRKNEIDFIKILNTGFNWARLADDVGLRGRMGKVARLGLQRAQVRFPGRARSTKPSIPPGSVSW
jgi:hypothetical protein